MPDINPAELSRPSVSLTTPILATKSINVSSGPVHKPKISQIIPARIDLEPLYTALKAAIGEQWSSYKEATTNFFVGRLNQAEFTERIDPILSSPTGEKEHLHNQLVAAIYGNVTREMPDQGLAPWVSANDKPVLGVGSKPATGDAREMRLKGEVMQLPSRDRRRVKDLMQNDFDPYESLASVFTQHHRAKLPRALEVPTSAAGGLNRMNFDLEIRKRYAQPLAIESGEFPDTSNVECRMLPFCYEAGLTSGHAADAAQFVSFALETYIKEVLSSVFSRTRSNAPGDAGSAGIHASWIQTQRYRRQLANEEEAAHRGEITRDKSGLLPVEAKAASERGPIGMADLSIALEMGDCGTAMFPIIHQTLNLSYREGELEDWGETTRLDGQEILRNPDTSQMAALASEPKLLPNGVDHAEAMDIDNDVWWDGAAPDEGNFFDGVLDSCLAVG